MLRSRKLGNIGDSFRRLRSLSKQIRDSMRKSKPELEAPPAVDKVEAGTCTEPPEKVVDSKQNPMSSKKATAEGHNTSGMLPRPESIVS
ncbi:hypothetical protein OESDEN_07124 [Oesophagostomum dentatum]|uniref:Uncharacterized protein n=1 Tax=Oesophagostomum dentatum TaxID=61180 RepID=A0A0B1T9X8_OESDE|nr:hypothetical protein OESDEN_07124 [Oesophagostomum dentatum]